MPRLLVVDDDPLVLRTATIILERAGFEVVSADGGQSGLEAIEEGPFDALLVDIFMPHMRGFESIRIFHERSPGTPLIAMSGYAFATSPQPAPDFLAMALGLGASACLRKPFTPSLLIETVRNCLAGPSDLQAGQSSAPDTEAPPDAVSG